MDRARRAVEPGKARRGRGPDQEDASCGKVPCNQAMSDSDQLRDNVRALIAGVSQKSQFDGLALHSIVPAASEAAVARVRDVAANSRNDYTPALRAKGVDAAREAGRLGQDEVRAYLPASILPRLAECGVILPLNGDLERDTDTVRIAPSLWKDIAPRRAEFAEAMRETGEHSRLALSTPPRPILIGGSVLEADGLTKAYRGRKVVNDVALRLQQGEIVGLLGPNGAGKTTTFYMIVSLIQPDSGRILLDGVDITKVPIYQRARPGIG